MTETFGDVYAASYDDLYSEKDYDAECDLLETIFRRDGRSVRTVLDLGCGTGAHAVRLAQRGYQVVGVDVSRAMLEEARRRAERFGHVVDLVEGDIRSIQLYRRFDAVICMFAVMGYQTADDDVARALSTVRGHLALGGPFVFDVWYGPAVESIGPSTRRKVVNTVHGEIERRATATLDVGTHICTVSYRLIRREPDQDPDVSEETHRMRYFFREELERHLDGVGLSLTDLMPFPDTTAPLTDESWNVLAVAR